MRSHFAMTPPMQQLAATIAATLLPVAAAAQTTSVLATERPITWGMIFALLFLMLGERTAAINGTVPNRRQNDRLRAGRKH